MELRADGIVHGVECREVIEAQLNVYTELRNGGLTLVWKSFVFMGDAGTTIHAFRGALLLIVGHSGHAMGW